MTSRDAVARHATALRREADAAMVGAIVGVGGYIAIGAAGVELSVETALAVIHKFLGTSAPLFGAAAVFLLWVVGALIVEIAGLTETRRNWRRVDAALFYLENAAPFVGLLECFISIVRALMAYAEAGISATAQSVLISHIAIALGASAAGCFVALFAHSLKALLASRVNAS